MGNYPWMCKNEEGAYMCESKPLLHNGKFEIEGKRMRLKVLPPWLKQGTLWHETPSSSPCAWAGAFWFPRYPEKKLSSFDILHEANREFGPNRTFVKAAEEAAELSAACAKLATTDGIALKEWDNVVDETADVEITNERVALLYPHGPEEFERLVHERKAYKLKRLEGILNA
ncbi:hypothetical protein [Maridesulfovibrio sp.]|uniref:hypothetical protein n=1 Tax=Maridesulfovibrio sp. TaxID=2795000 RepID=UPI002AA8DA2E|nr:hypothetical protein [Maridesulfovibrio sp.]